MKKTIKFFVLLLMGFYTLNATAQSSLEYKKAIASMKSSSLQIERDKASRIQNLANNLQPSIFINNGLIKKFKADSAVCVDTDAKSIYMLSNIDSLVGNVEFLRVRINSADDLNYVLNVASLSAYHKLKYILFLCSYNCDPALVKNMCQQTSSNNTITVFYEISIPN